MLASKVAMGTNIQRQVGEERWGGDHMASFHGLGQQVTYPFFPSFLVKFSWKCKLVLGPGEKEKFGE